MGLFILAGIAMAITAYSADTKSIDTTDCYSGSLRTLRMPNGTFGASWQQSGTRRASDTTSAFHNMTGECVGLLWSDADVIRGRSSCRYVDDDGDAVLTHGRREGDAFDWFFAGGTGKFERIEGGGAYTDVQYFPRLSDDTYQLCNRTTGSYTLVGTGAR